MSKEKMVRLISELGKKHNHRAGGEKQRNVDR